jgi:serine/threonine protein kinase
VQRPTETIREHAFLFGLSHELQSLFNAAATQHNEAIGVHGPLQERIRTSRQFASDRAKYLAAARMGINGDSVDLLALPEINLIDFGKASACGPGERSRVLLGTMPYLAPEMHLWNCAKIVRAMREYLQNHGPSTVSPALRHDETLLLSGAWDFFSGGNANQHSAFVTASARAWTSGIAEIDETVDLLFYDQHMCATPALLQEAEDTLIAGFRELFPYEKDFCLSLVSVAQIPVDRLPAYMRTTYEAANKSPADAQLDLCAADCFSAGILLHAVCMQTGFSAQDVAVQGIQCRITQALTRLRNKFRPDPSFLLRETSKVSVEAVDLFGRLTALDPSQRISIADALRHPWFAPLREWAVAARPNDRCPFMNFPPGPFALFSTGTLNSNSKNDRVLQTQRPAIDRDVAPRLSAAVHSAAMAKTASVALRLFTSMRPSCHNLTLLYHVAHQYCKNGKVAALSPNMVSAFLATPPLWAPLTMIDPYRVDPLLLRNGAIFTALSCMESMKFGRPGNSLLQMYGDRRQQILERLVNSDDLVAPLLSENLLHEFNLTLDGSMVTRSAGLSCHRRGEQAASSLLTPPLQSKEDESLSLTIKHLNIGKKSEVSIAARPAAIKCESLSNNHPRKDVSVLGTTITVSSTSIGYESADSFAAAAPVIHVSKISASYEAVDDIDSGDGVDIFKGLKAFFVGYPMILTSPDFESFLEESAKLKRPLVARIPAEPSSAHY